ncbi:MAG: TonB-dependent hemoglobin/transferrin/lactoferrin family receptor [Acidobacteria bacterium]|nr:TonB-dependent hemoglobin/transferrin/lactoferrin family receptor [Acidobacteriota bacterium]
MQVAARTYAPNPARRSLALQALGLATLALALTWPLTGRAHAQEAAGAAGAQTAGPPATAEPAPDTTSRDETSPSGDPLTFLDSVTVTATLRPARVRETPGVVSVIDEETIQERLIQNAADLVKYEPGVYVEGNVTRLGLNGFNIRGIGGNRVMTRIDGVETSEQFDFGPFNVHQVSFDVDALKSVEIVRSANSALYGSDALGGGVSLFTKDPADYLRGRRFHAGAKTTWDGRASGLSGNAAVAGGGDRLQGSLFASGSRGGEIRNQGTVHTSDATRTAPNPQHVDATQALAKVVFNAAPGNVLRASAEFYDTRVETEVLSQQGLVEFGPAIHIDTKDVDAVDTQDRLRLSLDHTLAGRGGLDLLTWRLYRQRSDTAQVVDDRRSTRGFGSPVEAARHGTVDFDQAGAGGSVQGQKRLGDSERGMLLTFGASYRADHFDILRNAVEIDVATGAEIPPRQTYPTKYFPESDVVEAGTYVQGELQLGRLTLVPGVRYDRFALDADQADPIFLASQNPDPADFSAHAVSPKVGAAARLTDVVTVHARYAAGFRAPPYSTINTGFTSFSAGYTTLPNPALRAETSDNLEVGVRTAFARASFDVTAFVNRYDDFIELATAGTNPATRLLEFQSRNVEQAEIAGLEVRGEAYLTGNLMLRGSYARIDGVSLSTGPSGSPFGEAPLGSIAPSEGQVGVRYVRPDGRWGGELSARLVEGYGAADAGDNQFAPAAYQVVDLVGFASLAEALTLRLGILNLTDAKFFEWWNVRGRLPGDPAIDRYSSPGISAVASLAYDW